MTFTSILFVDGKSDERDEAPEFFPDLNLNHVIDTVTKGFEEYRLVPLFHAPLQEVDPVLYRQEVFRDLEDPAILEDIQGFSREMRDVRSYLELSRKTSYVRERERWVLDAANRYCFAVESLTHRLRRTRPSSRGLRNFGDYLSTYTKNARFDDLFTAAKSVEWDLVSIRYDLVLKDDKISVGPDRAAADYSEEIETRFAKFRGGAVHDYRTEYTEEASLNHIEAAVIDRVALLFPGEFRALSEFASHHATFVDETLARFDREVQFYLAYHDHMDGLKKAGLRFCYPTVSVTTKDIECRGAFDLALANKLAGEGGAVVANDVLLHDRERLLVVTGPNQGGKSTFARMVGQLHYLAGLGCPVPGTEARLFLCDRLFTHFEKEENVANLRGKLQDDIVRVREIIDQATSRSVVIMNEVFSSTSLQDALYLSREIMGALSALDAITVWVTFLAELASFDEKTVSVAGALEADDPSRRTFRMERRRPTAVAYSLALAEKHRVTYEALTKRLAS